MYEFEATIRLLFALALGIGIVLAAGFGFKRLFRKARDQAGEDRLTAVDDRLAGLEAKIAELEERMDFAERMLTDVRGRLQIPGKSAT